MKDNQFSMETQLRLAPGMHSDEFNMPNFTYICTTCQGTDLFGSICQSVAVAAGLM